MVELCDVIFTFVYPVQSLIKGFLVGKTVMVKLTYRPIHHLVISPMFGEFDTLTTSFPTPLPGLVLHDDFCIAFLDRCIVISHEL